MKGTIRFVSGYRFFAVLFILMRFLTCPTPVHAQGTGTQGQNAVFGSSGCCVGSSAFLDASALAANVNNPDFCSVLNYVLLNKVPTTGAVIDARGLPGTTGTSMRCSASPWAGITSPPPSTILLPPGTIVISSPWGLPSNTHLIGEGDNDPSNSTPGTTIQVSGSFLAPGPLIQFGSSAGATGISVERLTLDGKGMTSTNGIVNQYAGTNSYVDHVALCRIRFRPL